VFTKTVTIAASLYLATVLYGAEKAKPVHGSIKILQQKYCYSDAETFVVSLKLKLRVRNASERATYLPSDMTPFTGRVARDLKSAKAGKFDYETVWSRATASPSNFKEIRIQPGGAGELIVGYDLIARFQEGQKLPRTVAPGKHVLQIVLHPNHQDENPNDIKTVITDPFVVHIPTNVQPQHCTAEAN
jgi:hypothetical protein